jgi:hypothetical protein
MTNHNFTTEVIDLRKIKAQPITTVGEAVLGGSGSGKYQGTVNHSTAVHAEQSVNWPQSQS